MRAHPHLCEINTWPWLEALSRRHGRPITLGSVPESEWTELRARGIDLVYLMGVWRRSAIGRQLARSEPALFAAYDEGSPGWQSRDVVGSAFCLADYRLDDRMGQPEELDAARATLHAHGMRLIVDFVPNHVGFDHPWIEAHPEWFVTADEAEFRRSPSAFRAIERRNGDVRFIACGRDPFFAPWTDVAQLNHCHPDMRAALLAALREIARHADGARCDMAMLVLSDVFARTWADYRPGAPLPTEFWADAAAAVPEFLLVAEAYWDLEWRLQQLGFAFTYDKRLYDRVLRGSAEDVRAHLRADAGYQNKSARFIENHDEPRSVIAFGDRASAAAVVITTLPGLRFYYEGQFEGRRRRPPVQLGVVAEEPADARTAEFYRRLLAIADDPVFHEGEWRLCEVAVGSGVSSGLAAWRWRGGTVWRLVVVNIGDETADGHVNVEGELPAGAAIVFDDLLNDARYRWSRADLAAGLYVRLPRGGAHIFSAAAVG